jgi:nitrite reductase (NO-forming)
MRLPKDRKDRALFGVLGVVGIATASFLGTTFLTPNFSIAFGPEAAAADFSAAAQPVYHAQIAHGPVPLAQVAVKMAKGEGPVDIVRDPAEVPPPVGTRGPERVRVELDTVEVTGKLTHG